MRARAGGESASSSTSRPVLRTAGPSRCRQGRGAVEVCVRITAKASTGEPVLDRLSLEIPPGRLLAVVGRSGAGKTTLAHLLGRLREPDEGDVLEFTGCR